MDISIYDRVLLKNGCKASIVEIFEENELFLADIDRDGDSYTEEQKNEEIERVL